MRRAWWAVFVGLLMAVARPATAAETMDSTEWDGLLRQYVHEGTVDYAAFTRTRAVLDRYLARLSAVHPEALGTRQAQLAFWINAYNACVIKGVLDHQPLRSVKDVKGFFDRIRYPVGGTKLTLNEIEAKGRALGDWRMHMAVVCASTSCPPLRSEAYQPERLDAQLTDQAARFLGDPNRGLRLDGTTVWISKVFQWYAKDVVPDGRLSSVTLLPVIEGHLSPEMAKGIRERRPTLKFLDYDWSLNAQRR